MGAPAGAWTQVNTVVFSHPSRLSLLHESPNILVSRFLRLKNGVPVSTATASLPCFLFVNGIVSYGSEGQKEQSKHACRVASALLVWDFYP